MKPLILKFFYISIVAGMLSSCVTYHGGYMTSSASLQNNNFEFVKYNVSGSAQATYVLGIGGFRKDALVADAKENLETRNLIKPNQTLANITVNWTTKITWLGLVTTKRCVVTADIIEFK
jgi:hypothetical protein